MGLRSAPGSSLCSDKICNSSLLFLAGTLLTSQKAALLFCVHGNFVILLRSPFAIDMLLILEDSGFFRSEED